MKKILFVVWIIINSLSPLLSQSVIVRDAEIEKMVREISRERIQQDIQKLVSFNTRHNLSVQDSPDKGIAAAWNWIKAEMEKSIPQSKGRLTVAFDDYTVGGEGKRIKSETHLKNVIATLKGTNPNDNRVFVVSAHMDSRVEADDDGTSFAPGADDDGSGVAAVLEMVRIMSKHEFSGTIVFMAVSGEEHGLFGSAHMAQRAKDENWNLVAMLNNDMIGNSSSGETMLNDNMRVRIFSEGVPAYETPEMEKLRKYIAGENDGKARQLARYIKEVGERYVDQLTVSLIYRNDRFGRGGDHTPFCQLGFTAVRICEYNENYDRTHKVPRVENGVQLGDLPEYVDYEYVRKNTGINLATLANLALAPFEPENTVVFISGLTNSTHLKWDAPSKGIKPAGYYILMRETSQPMWERKLFVTETDITLPYSKDNFLFAVQAVDSKGHESLPVIPVPAKGK